VTLTLRGTTRVGDFLVDIDLTVERRETVALVGPNGAGKSTVISTIAGLESLESGQLSVDGTPWDEPAAGVFVRPEVRRVGLVFQRYRLFEHLTALENVAFGLRASGTTRRDARAAAADQLHALALGDVGERRPASLSGGEAQRVALARALVLQPSVLLLDEPMAALDASIRGVLRRDLRRWIGEVDGHRLIVTHDPVDAHALADRVVVLEAGRVTQRGTLSELAAAPRSNYVADLVGTNIVRGELSGGSVATATGTTLSIGAHEAQDGPVIATIRPAAVALHRHQPEGSPRNVWSTTIDTVDVSHGRVRVRVGAPLALAVELTSGGFDSLEAEPGDEVWASIKASEIAVVNDG